METKRRHPRLWVTGKKFSKGGGFVGNEVDQGFNNIGYVGKNAGIFDRVTIRGCNGKLRVENEGVVFDNVKLHGPIRVYGKAKVYDKAVIDNHASTPAKIFGKAQVYESVEIYGNPMIYDKAKIHGNVQIRFGNVEICGNTDIHGKLIISGNMKIDGGKYCSKDTREVKSKKELEKCKCKCNDKKNPINELDDLDDLDNLNV